MMSTTTTIDYTGGGGLTDVVCPITYIPLEDLDLPVAFRCNPSQPYECEAIITWLKIRKTNPMTNLYVSWPFWAGPTHIIAPLTGHCRNPAAAVRLLNVELSGKL